MEDFEKYMSELIQEKKLDSGLIEFSLGMKYFEDSEELYLEMMEIFCKMFDNRYAVISKCFEEHNWNLYVVNIHGLKSNALNIGGKQLFEQCLMLEKAGKQVRESGSTEGVEYLLKNHPIVMELYRDTIEEAEAYLTRRKKT